MRIVLLSLALFYAWLPSGLCACGLQAALFPPPANEPCHEDHDDSHECHCVGVKPPCILLAPVEVDGNLSQTALVPKAVHDEIILTEAPDTPLCPFVHACASPLYLTLRALRI